MITILKNNFERTKSNRAVLFIAFVVMPALIGAAVFFSVHTASKESIAVPSYIDCSRLDNSQYDFTAVDEPPALSELVQGTYAAYVEENSAHSYDIISLKSDQDKQAVITLFETGKLPADYKSDEMKRQERGVGTNILGFITMLVLMQGVALTALYSKDRMNQTFRRVMCSPVSGKHYMAAQFILTFVCLFVPTYAAIFAIHLLFHISVGYSMGTLALLLLLLIFFAAGFSLFISSVLDRNTNLAATGISVVTCILAGCFLSISTGRSGGGWILKIIPQTEFMDLVHHVEFGKPFPMFDIFYIIGWALLLLLSGLAVSQKRVRKGSY